MADDERKRPSPFGKEFGCFRLSFRKSSSSASSSNNQIERPLLQRQNASRGRDTTEQPESSSSNVRPNRINLMSNSVVSFVRSFVPAWYLLKPDPSDTIYFPYNPDRRVRSAVKITNRSKYYVAFKLEVNQPGCSVRPEVSIISPGWSIIVAVSRFIPIPKRNQKPLEMTRKIQCRLLSLKVKELTDNVEQLFAEQRHKVIVQQILYCVFLDIDHPDLEASKKLLAESDAAYWASFPTTSGTKPDDDDVDDDEVWRARRERYLAWERTHVYDGSKKKVGEDN